MMMIITIIIIWYQAICSIVSAKISTIWKRGAIKNDAFSRKQKTKDKKNKHATN